MSNFAHILYNFVQKVSNFLHASLLSYIRVKLRREAGEIQLLSQNFYEGWIP